VSPRIGYFLLCEEYAPHELVEQAVAAEQAGFGGLWISDHFHPWNDEQGQSPFVWSVIGAISQVCKPAGDDGGHLSHYAHPSRRAGSGGLDKRQQAGWATTLGVGSLPGRTPPPIGRGRPCGVHQPAPQQRLLNMDGWPHERLQARQRLPDLRLPARRQAGPEDVPAQVARQAVGGRSVLARSGAETTSTPRPEPSLSVSSTTVGRSGRCRKRPRSRRWTWPPRRRPFASSPLRQIHRGRLRCRHRTACARACPRDRDARHLQSTCCLRPRTEP
jgi:hypothetical protein